MTGRRNICHLHRKTLVVEDFVVLMLSVVVSCCSAGRHRFRWRLSRGQSVTFLPGALTQASPQNCRVIRAVNLFIRRLGTLRDVFSGLLRNCAQSIVRRIILPHNLGGIIYLIVQHHISIRPFCENRNKWATLEFKSFGTVCLTLK